MAEFAGHPVEVGGIDNFSYRKFIKIWLETLCYPGRVALFY